MSDISGRRLRFADLFPKIQEYNYHLSAIAAAATHLELDAVSDSISSTVNPKHRDYHQLVKAGTTRREELGAEKAGIKAETALF